MTNLKGGLNELGRKVEALEKANKQIDLSSLSRISAQVDFAGTRARAQNTDGRTDEQTDKSTD